MYIELISLLIGSMKNVIRLQNMEDINNSDIFQSTMLMQLLLTSLLNDIEKSITGYTVLVQGHCMSNTHHHIRDLITNHDAFISVTAAPICLNDKPEIVINERASLIGWGKLSGQNNLVRIMK